MVHRPLSPGPLRLMCLRMISQAIYSYLECRPRLEKYLRLCGPQAPSQAAKLTDYVRQFLPGNLRSLLLEFLIQLWFARLLKMKQKTIEHERMSAGDPTHDHAVCGGTTSVSEAQRATALLAEILTISMTEKTQSLRLGFTNARSGQVDFTRPMEVVTARCSGLRHLDLTFATDTLAPSLAEGPPDSFNTAYAREVAALCRALAAANTVTTVKLLMCNKAILKELARCSKLQVLEMVEASGLQDSDLAEFSMGEARHHLTRLHVKFWSDSAHIKALCETDAPRKLGQGLARGDGRVRLPSWAVFLLNCRALQEVQWFEPAQIKPFNPLVGLLTLLREARRWGSLDIENEGDLLDMVIERPSDLDRVTFAWASMGLDMGNDGLAGAPSEAELNDHMEFLDRSLPSLNSLSLTLFPSPPHPAPFLTLQGLTSTPAGQHLASRITSLRIQACHPSHLAATQQLLTATTSLTSLTMEHLTLATAHHVVNLDTRHLLSWIPPTLTTLKVRGFHLLPSTSMEGEQGGPSYPFLTTLEVVFCGTSDRDLLHLACLCPALRHLTVVVSMTSGGGGPPAPPTEGLVTGHLHALCHNPGVVECIVLVKAGEGWLQVDDRDMLGELVLGAASPNLRKIVLFPVRGVCGNGLRSLVRAARQQNICLNIGVGNQRPVKTETNRRVGTDEFTLAEGEEEPRDTFADFGRFLASKVAEFEGQFWNDPVWFYSGVWPDSEPE